ncbi:hypothetical protein [Mycobacteroides abscessus]|uniref:hypothetical protein n=1 Tax=Mycobacteroides abscessus TaxID=36809 RepID=UPI00092CD282|nr:hypothetical protein [Mycobacteroides abscessus]QST89655.1 polymorphic toxin immunity protein [Mycobacterium phage prophi62-3]QST89998.1 immunity protein [Mycobacterium phage prophi108-1]MBN7458114.1 hypothetical protein [Mycobacteroides abscessus subsp. abscessus]MBN7542327.1 hypothetical protein [Mycobacteroides abscessus subsp. abscessus]MBN7569990.1 hypothetical protein [Mycobacteroides abscessus subsp. abscessus]
MNDTSSDKRVVFTAAIASAVAYGALASFFVAHGGLESTTIYLTILGLFIVLPIVGFAMKSLSPQLGDYARGIMLSPLPGAITYLLGIFWVAIT